MTSLRVTAGKFLGLILVTGFLVRGGALAANYANPGNYQGDSLNAAEIGVQLALYGRIGVVDGAIARIIHGAAQEAGRLVDPEDLGLRERPAGPAAPQVQEHIGLGLLMGALWWLTGSMRFIWVQLAQVALDMLCVVLVYRAGMNFFGHPGMALAAAALYALFPVQIYLVTLPAGYGWMMFLAVGLLWFLSASYGRWGRAAGRGAGLGAWLALGGVLGVFAAIRSTALLLPVAVILGMLWAREAWGRVLVLSLALLLGQVLVLSPLLLRNYRETGVPRVTRGIFWHTVWAGFGAHENPFGAVNEDQVIARGIEEEHPGILRYGEPYETILKERVARAIRSHPGWLVRVLLERLALLVVPGLWTAPVIAPLFLLAYLGGRVLSREGLLGRRELGLIAFPTLYYFLSVMAVYKPSVKYVLPGYATLLLLAGGCVLLLPGWGTAPLPEPMGRRPGASPVAVR